MSGDQQGVDLGVALHFWARNACNEAAVYQAATKLGVFRVLPGSAPGMTAVEAADRLGCSARGLRSLLEPLTALGILSLDDENRFSISEAGRPLAEDPALIEEIVEASRWWPATERLPEAITRGGPVEVDGRSWDVLGEYQRQFLTPASDRSAAAASIHDAAVRHALRTAALIAAGKLGVLARVGAGEADAGAIANELKLDVGAASVLLGVLAQMGIVSRSEKGYRFSEAASGLLDSRSLPYFTRTLPVTALYWDALGKLDETVRSERYILDLKDPEISSRFYSENAQQITSIFASHFQLSRKAAAMLQRIRSLEGAQVLDVGTGSGVWGAAFAHADRTAQVTFLDQAEVLEHTRRNLEKLKLAANAKFWPGSCLDADYGEARFDVIILPQVCNVLSPHELAPLYAKLARALKPKGALLIAEYVLTDRRDGPLDYLYFGLRRFMTNEGDLLSLPEYTALLTGAGLPSVKCYQLPAQELVVATRGDLQLPETV